LDDLFWQVLSRELAEGTLRQLLWLPDYDRIRTQLAEIVATGSYDAEFTGTADVVQHVASDLARQINDDQMGDGLENVVCGFADHGFEE